MLIFFFYISGVELLRFDVNPSDKKQKDKHQNWQNEIASQMTNHIDEQIEVNSMQIAVLETAFQNLAPSPYPHPFVSDFNCLFLNNCVVFS